jgi:tetratricopeptide (TPR) repeat protein
MVSKALDNLGQFIVYLLLLIAVNALSSVSAADTDYEKAAAEYNKRDIVSQDNALSQLEKILEKKPDNVEAQALAAYVYAHKAYVLRQLGNTDAKYLNSAETLTKAVTVKQPKNIYARKATIFLQLMSNSTADARRTLEREVGDAETDPDLWYMLACVSDRDKSYAALTRALKLPGSHIWIYTDMAFQALKSDDLPTAEKWISYLEARHPNLAEADMLKAVLAAKKKDNKQTEYYWKIFAGKLPTFRLTKNVSGQLSE